MKKFFLVFTVTTSLAVACAFYFFFMRLAPSVAVEHADQVQNSTEVSSNIEEQALQPDVLQRNNVSAPGILRDLPEQLKPVFDPSLGYVERLGYLHDFNWEQDASLARLVADYLLLPISSGESRETELAIRNDVLGNLIEEPAFAEITVGLLIRGADDVTQDPIWREYLLQHYSVFVVDYLRSGAVKEALFQELNRSLFDRMAERSNGMAGTALLNYVRLNETHPDWIEAVDWRVEAASIAFDPTAHLSSRIAAFQTLPLDSPEVRLDEFHKIIKSDGADFLLKLAASGYLQRSSWGNLPITAK